jgi:hypothetical protein
MNVRAQDMRLTVSSKKEPTQLAQLTGPKVSAQISWKLNSAAPGFSCLRSAAYRSPTAATEKFTTRSSRLVSRPLP